jgi:hypothetical protein
VGDTGESRNVTETLTLQAAKKSEPAWTLSFMPDAVHLQCSGEASGQIGVTVTRAEFFRRLDYHETFRSLTFLAPERVQLRLTAQDSHRLLRWLGPASQAELKHILNRKFWVAAPTAAFLMTIALFPPANTTMAVLAALALASAATLRFWPRAWLLLFQALVWGVIGASAAYQLMQGTGFSTPLALSVAVVGVFTASAAWESYLHLESTMREPPSPGQGA